MQFDRDLAALMAEQDEFSSDKLDVIHNKMRAVRDLRLEIKDLEEQLKTKKNQLNELTMRDLPDLMLDVRQNYLELPAEGNHPPVAFRVKPYYKANIDNNSPESMQAYQWLEEHGEGDIIKRTVTASLGKDSGQDYKEITEYLDSLDIPYESKFGVPWNTLTAWLKDRHQRWLDQQGKTISPEEKIVMPPLEPFGAFIGQVVEVKDKK